MCPGVWSSDPILAALVPSSGIGTGWGGGVSPDADADWVAVTRDHTFSGLNTNSRAEEMA